MPNLADFITTPGAHATLVLILHMETLRMGEVPRGHSEVPGSP